MFTLYRLKGFRMDVLQHSIKKHIRKEAKLELEFIGTWSCVTISIAQLNHTNTD